MKAAGPGLAALATVALVYVAARISPAAAVAGVGLVILIVALCCSARLVVAAVGFLTTAVPKAGLRLSSLPLPFLLFALVVAVALIATLPAERPNGPEGVRTQLDRTTQLIGILVAVWTVGRVLAISSLGTPTGNIAALLAWCIVPIMFALVAMRADVPTLAWWGRALDVGFIVAALYGLAQLVVGIDTLSIPGVTIASGDDPLAKSNTLLIAGGESSSKIPSTYQNGNIFGLVAAFFLVMALLRLLSRRAHRYDSTLFTLSALSVVLSQSRTALIAAGTAIAIAIAIRGRLRDRIITVALVVAAYLVGRAVLPGFTERFSLAAILNSNGAGRTTQWSQILSTMSGNDFLFGTWKEGFGTSANPQGEGWLGIIQQIGLLGTVAFVAFFVMVTRPPALRPWRLPLLAILIGMVLDSTYFVFPTLFIPAARLIAPFARPVVAAETAVEIAEVRTSTRNVRVPRAGAAQ